MTEAPLIPFPFQEADVIELLENDYTGFVVAETGAGKSLIGTEAGIRSGASVILVIAPLGTHKDVWMEGILRQDPTANVRVVENKTEAGQDAMFDLELGEPGWYIITPQLFTRRESWKGVEPTLCIVDEAHLLGRRGSDGNDALLSLKARHRIVMSGTMVRNKFENFYGLLRWVYPDRNDAGDIADTSYNRWVQIYCETTYDHFAPGNIKIVGELVPGTMAGLIPCYIQHFKRAECCEFHPEGFLHDLPAPIDQQHMIGLTDGQKVAIKRMTENYIAWVDARKSTGELTRKALTVKLPMVAQIRLRQMTLGMPSFIQTGEDKETGLPLFELYFAPGCDSPKLDKFIQRLQENPKPYLALTSSEKFATEVVRRLQERGITAAKWAGTVSQKQRDISKQKFIDGEIRVVVGVIEAVSTGIDGLQFATSNLFWFDRSRDLTSNIQTEGRADRRGQKEQVLNEEAVAIGSMDQNIIDEQLVRRFRLNRSLRRELAKREREEKERARNAA